MLRISSSDSLIYFCYIYYGFLNLSCIGYHIKICLINNWEVWRALKKLELLEAMPQATLTHSSCPPNFPRASYLDDRMLTNEPIVKFKVQFGIKSNL